VSQVLVAFTLEFDDDCERRLIDAGYRGALSLVVWTNLVPFLAHGAIPMGNWGVGIGASKSRSSISSAAGAMAFRNTGVGFSERQDDGEAACALGRCGARLGQRPRMPRRLDGAPF
jgi:hypothetical protein